VVEMPVIEARGLAKAFGGREVLRDVSFSVGAGEVFGLLGPNGAGKTTTMRLFLGLLRPGAGEALVFGAPLADRPDLRRRVGVLLEQSGMSDRLTARENLAFYGALHGVGRDAIDDRLAHAGLLERADEQVGTFSTGMKRRLGLVRATMHDPEVLFLDEPTIGLDPVGAREFRNVILNLQSEKKTILLTTHYMFEADALCDRIAVINHGKIIALDTPRGLKQHVSDLFVVEVETFGAPEVVLQQVRNLPFVDSLSVEDNEQRQMLLVQTRRGAEAVPDIMAALDGQRMGRVIVREPTLEDAYVRLVGGRA